ncbi:MAG: tape measure protein, partial [Cucumibacter sp.]
RMADQAKRAHSVFLRLSGVLSVIGVSLGVGALVRYADSWSDMQSRVGAAIKDMAAAPIMMQRIVDIANASYSPLAQTVEVYSRNVSVLRDLGLGAEKAADFTESLNHMLVLTATRGERAESVQNALSKAMAVGRLQADGLETILAHGGRVAEALAEELGTTVSGLRDMASQGLITGQVIANAIIKPLDGVREAAGKMPATIADAFTRVQTNVTAFIGQFDKAHGISERVALAIIAVAGSLGTLAKVVALAGVGLLTYFAPAILSGIAVGLGYIGAAGVAAFRAIGVAIAANPLGALILAVNLVLTALFLFRDKIAEVFGHDLAGYVIRFGDFLINSFEAAFEDAKFIWANLPDVLGAAMIGAANAVIRGINGMVQGAAQGIDWLIEKINKIPGVNVGKIGAVSPLGEMDNPFAGQLAGALAEHAAAIDSIMSQDRLGQWIDGTGEAAAATLEFATATATANDNIADLGNGVGTATGQITTLADRTSEARGVFTGFFEDVRSGIRNGEGAWRSLGNAAVNALDSISRKLLDMSSNKLFDILLGAVAGGLGGGFGSVPGMLYAKGGIQSGAGISAFSNSIVNSPTVFPFARGIGMMGEAGPEAIMPLKRGPDGTLGVAAGGGGGGGRIDIRLHVDQDGNWQAAVDKIAGTAADVRVNYNNRFTIPRIVMATKGNTMVETGKAA